MKRIQIIGLCFAAVLAFSAVSATGAYATPEFTKPSGGAFPQHFTSTGGAGTLSTANHTVTCPESKDLGKILAEPSTTSSMLGDLEVTFEKCKSTDFGGGACTTAGQASGIILTPEYKWHIGALREPTTGHHDVLLLVLSKPPTTFVCANSFVGNVNISVEGNLVGLILETDASGHTQIGVATNTIEVEFEAASPGVQKHKEFEFTLPAELIKNLFLNTTTKNPTLGEKTEESSEEAKGKETLLNNETVELKG